MDVLFHQAGEKAGERHPRVIDVPQARLADLDKTA
jgi:hypothetical protein